MYTSINLHSTYSARVRPEQSRARDATRCRGTHALSAAVRCGAVRCGAVRCGAVWAVIGGTKARRVSIVIPRAGDGTRWAAGRGRGLARRGATIQQVAVDSATGSMIFAPLWFTFGAVHVPSFALPSAFASFAPSLPGDVLAVYTRDGS